MAHTGHPATHSALPCDLLFTADSKLSKADYRPGLLLLPDLLRYLQPPQITAKMSCLRCMTLGAESSARPSVQPSGQGTAAASRRHFSSYPQLLFASLSRHGILRSGSRHSHGSGSDLGIFKPKSDEISELRISSKSSDFATYRLRLNAWVLTVARRYFRTENPALRLPDPYAADFVLALHGTRNRALHRFRPICLTASICRSEPPLRRHMMRHSCEQQAVHTTVATPTAASSRHHPAMLRKALFRRSERGVNTTKNEKH